MRRTHIISLALLFVTAGVMTIITAIRYRSNDDDSDNSITVTHDPSGSMSTVQTVSWKDLPSVDPFRATERSGQTFDSSEFEDRVWVVSFFFTACPSICREQNSQLAILHEAYSDEDVTFVSITCDPKNDTAVRLREYAQTFQASPDKWLFLTGEFETLKHVSEKSFFTALSTETHGTNFMLVDKWGRFRDRFNWQDTEELVRMRTVLDQVLDESEPPTDQTVETRTPIIEREHTEGESEAEDRQSSVDEPDQQSSNDSWKDQPWIESFELTAGNGDVFSTREMEGRVWVGSFFFTSCPSICRQQNAAIEQLVSRIGDRDVTYVSITTDPDNDTPERLAEYAEQFDTAEGKWQFLTGESLLIRRIAAEFFARGLHGDDAHSHASELMLVDKWGNVRDYYDWDDEASLVELRKQIDRLMIETSNPDETTEAQDELSSIEEARE